MASNLSAQPAKLSFSDFKKVKSSFNDCKISTSKLKVSKEVKSANSKNGIKAQVFCCSQ